LVHLKGMTSLESLRLVRTKVTDVGLEHLKGLVNLQTLDLRRTSVTMAGVKDFQSVLPNCKISN
jgi:internalin A